MATQKKPIMIIGEGETEFYYLNSLKDILHGIRIEPTTPKHSSLEELSKRIEIGIQNGYDKILCIIDLDNKNNPKEAAKYSKLVQKYAKPIEKRRKGIKCEVKFYETHRCTELFFLYYFEYTSRPYHDQPSLIKDVNKHCIYQKEVDFFQKCKGLHSHFVKNGGKLEAAIANSKRSYKEHKQTGRTHTYSRLGEMFDELLKPT